MQAGVINGLLKATTSVFSSATQCELTMAAPPERLSSPMKEEHVCIMVGTTGALRGQVLLSMTEESALSISNAMMGGLGSGNFDEMAKSCLQELGNMIMGNFSTVLSTDNILIDITPPTLIQGSGISISGNTGIRIKLKSDHGELYVTIMMKDN